MATLANDTNNHLAKVCADVAQLITWAEADAETSEESNAPTQARDDRQRAKLLRQALALLQICER